MFGSIGAPELFLILVVVLLLFGVGRVGKLGGEMGSAVRAFRQGLSGDDGKPKKEETAPKSE
jgi:sec-independent protein translocase protein TatA